MLMDLGFWMEVMWRCLVKSRLETDRMSWIGLVKNWRVILFEKICRLAWAATFNCIWMDTNARIHNGKIRSGTELLNIIFFAVKSRISTCRNLKNTIQNKVLPSLWRIPSYLCLYLKPISCSYCILLVLLVSLLLLLRVESPLSCCQLICI